MMLPTQMNRSHRIRLLARMAVLFVVTVGATVVFAVIAVLLPIFGLANAHPNSLVWLAISALIAAFGWHRVLKTRPAPPEPESESSSTV